MNKFLKKFHSAIRDCYHAIRQMAQDEAQALAHGWQLQRLNVAHYLEEHLHKNPKYQVPGRIVRYGHQVYSQYGEDGMITEIFRRIGTTSRYFVEFGVQNGLECNTLYRLVCGWSGSWIEGDAEAISQIQTTFATQIKEGQLGVKHAFITTENIESLLTGLKVPAEFDLLSIDIDGNDYWVWKAIQCFRPRVVVIEYNSMFPPDCLWVRRYAPDACWQGGSYFGASLKSLELLGREKGYSLVGCSFAGTNAFFVRSDLCAGQFLEPYSAENHYEPSRYFLRTESGHRTVWGDFDRV